MRRALILGAALAATGCAWRLGPPEVTMGEATPVALVQPSTDPQRWYVPVDSDSLGPQLWFFDTGYSYSTCDDDLVAQLGLETRRAQPVRGELGSVPTRKAQLPALELGGHVIEDLVCQVRDLATTSSIEDPDEVPVAGVLGIDVLRRFRVVIDPASGRLELRDPDTVDPLPRTGRGIGPLRREQRVGIRSVVPVAAGDSKTWAVLDTGASHSHVDVDRLGLEVSYTRDDVAVRGTGLGTIDLRTVAYAEVPQVRVCGVATRRVVFTQRDRGPFTPGLLGLDLIGRYRMELDFGRRRARLERVTPMELPTWEAWYASGGRLPTGRLRDDGEGVAAP